MKIDALILDNLSWIKGVSLAFCRNKADAEDLAGDTILKVLLNADRYDSDKSFRLWVLVIMRNTYRIKLRHKGVVEHFEDLPDCPCFCDPCASTITDDSLRVIGELAESSVGVRAAILYAEGYSYHEIADMQGVSTNIVKSRIHHGRKLIARRLSG